MLLKGHLSPMWLYRQHNQSLRVTDGGTVPTLSASLQHKTTAAMNSVCQTMLKWKLLHIIYAKSH